MGHVVMMDERPEQLALTRYSRSLWDALAAALPAKVRRVTAIRALLGDRLKLFVGVDDAIVEGIAAGPTGWIAGLVNAMPAESVALFTLVYEGKSQEAFELYRWFLPLLRMDTVPKFIQLIKYVQQQLGVGSARVRPPRLEITGNELAETRQIVVEALCTRPKMKQIAFAGSTR